MQTEGYIHVYYADETGFQLNSNVPYRWQPIGKQLEMPVKTDKKRLNVLALLGPDDRLICYDKEKSLDSEFVIQCLDDFVTKLKKPTVVILDNAPIHQSELIHKRRQWWEAQGLFLIYLPTYSPHLNPLEIVWKRIKHQWLTRKRLLSYSKMVKRLKYILTNYGSEFCINFKERVFTN